MSISANSIVKIYGAQRALNGISFSISKGEVIGFLGPNGAGKSTMMKIITGYIPPSEGSVEVCGFNISSNSLEARRCIGYLPEHNPLYLDMYVREYLTFVAQMYKLSDVKKRVDNMIDRVGLGIEAHKKIEALSKGYRQRVGLAQAMIHDPEVFILDEPTSGLDPNQLVDVRTLIRDLGKEKTVMLSTHIMQEVEAICSRSIIISKGNIVADRSINDLRTGFLGQSYEVTIELSGEMDSSKFKSIPGVVKVIAKGKNTWTVFAEGEIDIRIGISAKASENGLQVLTLKKEEHSLESVFKELTTN